MTRDYVFCSVLLCPRVVVAGVWRTRNMRSEVWVAADVVGVSPTRSTCRPWAGVVFILATS